MNPEDVRITHFYLGPGRGSSIQALYLPTGASVSEQIPAGSIESGSVIQDRLLSALKAKIEEASKHEKA